MPSERAARRVFCRRRRQAVAAGNQKGGTAAKHRRKAEISREAAKGFNWIARSCLLCAATSRFAKPRSFLKKVLIVAVRSCGCGVLIRGLQNLETSCKRNVFRTFRVYEKYQKYTRGLRTSGLRGRFKALSEVILQSFPAAHVETGFAHKTAAKRL